MQNFKRFFSMMLAIVMVFGLVNHPVQVQAAGQTDTYVNQLISYYKNYQEKASTDIERVLEELKVVDESSHEDWKEIMDYWSYVNTEMTVNLGVAPDGLPEDDSLAIVVLGFALNSDGTMKDELIGRLQVGLESAKKYPNSYIVCTGGGTAANNPNVTEGGLMGDWLVAQGLDESRVIVEDRAPDTVGNALNTYKILVEEYPQVESVCLITSDYHVPRGCLLFNSKFILAATEAGTKPLNIVANAGYETGTNGYETVALQANGVASVAGISLSGNVTLSLLSYLKITLNEAYVSGNELDLTVTAGYDSGYAKDVTDQVVISGFDASLGADQTITVSYTENDETITGSFTLSEMSKEIVVTASLEALIEEAKAVNAEDYSAASVAVLNEAVTSATALLESGSYTAKDISDAYEALQNAYDGLIKIMNASYLKNVTASCNQEEASKLVNGSTSDYWTSKDANGDVAIADSYFTIDLDAEYELDRIHVVPYYGNERYYQYDVQISTDGENWETVVEHRSTDACTAAGNVHEMEAGIYARYVKVAGVAVHRPDKPITNFHVKEVSVYGVESNNIALGKPITSSGTDTSASSSSGSNERKVVDGDRESYWDGGKYSAKPWVSIQLGEVYKLDSVNVINYWNGSSRYYQYEVYTSIDGENYSLLAVKDDTETAKMFGETYECDEVYAAYVKVVGTYNSKNSAFHLNEVRVFGEVADEESYKEYQYKEAKNSLNQLVEEYEAQYQSADYTSETWKIYEAALDSAKALLEKQDALMEDFYAEIDSLKVAAEQLKYFVNEKPEGVYRLASTNLYAKGHTDIEGVLEKFYDRYDIDYAGLQEVDRNTTRNPIDMMEELTTDSRFVDFAFNKNMDYQGGEYGIGIISTTEIKEKDGGMYTLLGSEEPRGWVRTVLEIDGKEVAFYDTHLSTEDEACISNMAEIIQMMDEDPLEYKILTADFNCNREWMYPFLVNYNMANGKDGLWYATSGDDYTDIASSEAYGLDNIITSRNIDVRDFKVVDSEDLSDHNFVYIDFALLDEEVPSKEYLKIEVEDAKKLEVSDYTEESYAVLASALEEAAALADDASQKEINAVLFKLQAAVENLERVAPLISVGKPVAVQGEIADGKAQYVNDGDVYTYLKTNYSSEVVVDLEELYDIDEIQVFPYGKAPRYYHYTLYTSIDGVNYDYFGEKNSNEIANIKMGEVHEKEDCQARYVMIKMTYNSASTSHVYLSEMNIFGTPADGVDAIRTALGSLIANYEQLDAEGYIPSSYEAFLGVMADVKVVYQNESAEKEELEAAYNTLLTAFENLKPVADKTDLLTLLEECKNMDLSEYSARTVANLNAKVSEAEAICEDANVLQSDVDAACERLEVAVKLLAAPVDAAYKMEMTSTENCVLVTLDGIYNLDEIVVVTEADGERAYNYDVMVSADGESWTKAAEQTGDVVATEEGYVHEVDNTLDAKYIKVESTDPLAVKTLHAYGEDNYNIALGKPVTTSELANSKGALDINDGDRSNYWEAGKHAQQPWAVIDLEGLYKLDSINVITYWSRNDRYYNYELYTSTDGENYTLFATRDNTDKVDVYGDTFEAEGEVYATHIKIVGTYNSANSVFHLNELRAYGEPAGTTPDPKPPVEPDVDPADDSKDVPVDMYTPTAGSTQPGNSPDAAFDGDPNSFWEVVWDIGNTEPEVMWYQIELADEVEIDAVRYLPRWGGNAGNINGFITQYLIQVSTDGENWTDVAEGTWEQSEGWKIAEFEAITAKYVRITGVGTWADVGENSNMSIAEIRVRATAEVINKGALKAAIADAKEVAQELYTSATAKALADAIAAGEALVDDETATQEAVDAAAEAIAKAKAVLVAKATAEEKAVLEEAVDAAEAMDTTGYTEESAAAVADAIAAAKAVLDDTDATSKDVKDAADDLRDAVDALEIPVVEDEVVRLFGQRRYDTAYAVVNALKAVLDIEKFEAVVVATGTNFADALAGSYLAVEKNAPILLTNGKDANVAQLHAYIKANVAEGGKVYILGGEGAVPMTVDGIDGYEVERLFGDSRYDTNLEILKEAGVTGDSIIVATGKTFADSLSASAAKLPILLVKPNAALNDAQKEILTGMKNIYIVGGDGAVSTAYEAELKAFGEVTRVSGKSRYETSVEVAKTFCGEVDFAVVASGKNFPDGLCGGPLAAALNAPLVLTKDGGAEAAADYAAENAIASGYVLGGTGALADETVVEVFALESAEEIK